ncbi:putative NBD/HSP70 family sugar kinase [Motilibacter rhizosphaerae]|uniref:Putative NBD/HSP70 family sugar kinase n=1 Tax=Motilibacter rhizosphaerae TaxID=598652 RepID=A0A4V2F4P4_9ACTN|nr:ROK family protein [Motilibacter rhizosphaerae]RZS90029.1 putative NBD/HSP70 family sugar kinase [Motilibacter rhizosphaerae]
MTTEPAPATPSLLRTLNDRAALDLLLLRGPLSRTQLGALTGLSKPTCGQLLTRLSQAGLVRSVGHSTGSPGPAAELFEVDPTAGRAGALDVRPGRVTAAVVDLHGNELGRAVVKVTRRGPDAVGSVTRALDSAAAAAGTTRADLDAVVAGTPGSFDPETGELRYAKHLLGWHEPGLVDRLRSAVGVPFALENDVNLVALAERRAGAGRDVEDFFLLWNDDGFGAAVVLGGRLHQGASGGAGEVSFLPVPGAPLVRHVTRSNTGGFVKLAGSPAVLELAEEHGIPGRTAPAVVARAAAEPAAAEFLDELAERLATGLAAVIAVLDPQAVVLSGSILAAGGEPLRTSVERKLGDLAMTVPLVRTGLVVEDPVLTGAQHAALDAARDAVFASR